MCLLTLNPRCEVEERNTRRLEQQVDVLRQSKKAVDQRSASLQEDIRRSMMELQEMHQDFQVTQMYRCSPPVFLCCCQILYVQHDKFVSRFKLPK